VGGPGSSIPVAFTIPCDARETDARNPSDEIFWKLTASAALGGLDFKAAFRIPVFKTESSDASLTTAKLNERSEAVGVLNRSLHIRSSCLGFSRSRIVDAAAIRRFELYPGMRSADRIWFDLKIHIEGGGTITAASAMDKGEAEWFVGELKKDLGMQTRDATS